MAYTGARISEALELSNASLDAGNGSIVFRTLKQRSKREFRLVPVPRFLLGRLLQLRGGNGRLWLFGRTCAWKRVKLVMRMAGIADAQCKPKALRHGFAVDAILNGVPLNIVQRWMGHARLETTAIYTSVTGDEERQLAKRTWSVLKKSLVDHHANLS